MPRDYEILKVYQVWYVYTEDGDLIAWFPEEDLAKKFVDRCLKEDLINR